MIMTKEGFRKKCVRREMGKEGEGSDAWLPGKDSRRGGDATIGDVHSPN